MEPKLYVITQIQESSIILRLRCGFEVLIATNNGECRINEGFQSFLEKLKNSPVAFKLQSEPVLFLEGQSVNYAAENGKESLTVGDLLPKAAKKTAKTKNSSSMRILDTEMLEVQGQSSTKPVTSPTLSTDNDSSIAMFVKVPVDAILVLEKTDDASNVHTRLTQLLQNHIELIRACMVKFKQAGKVIAVEPFHFRPMNKEYIVATYYPTGVDETELETFRRSMHESFQLPMDRPLFRRGNIYRFNDTETPGGYLLNVHEGLPTVSPTGGQLTVVQGLYSYHHYMQDRFDDNGWGCAYRSLQSVCSWFNLQGYTSKPVPNHRDIQQILVDVGDKQAKFVGSKQWIGSMEVSFVLNNYLGVESKIMFVSSGADLKEKARELAVHFENQGTPIMIGGGVLAHTILGIDFNSNTGDVRFLILDPHYTGAEETEVILKKGWCGWKKTDFWEPAAYYNLCMPQRPIVI